MITQTQILTSQPEDIVKIFELYHYATDYMRSKKTVVVWPEFERKLVERELAEKRLFKIEINGQVACVWAITFSDTEIWEGSENDAAVYIHRIATHPDYRKQNFVAAIVDWARKYAADHGKRFIRLDTLGRNEKLIEHYTRNGFQFLGMFKISNTEGLPGHYQHGEPAALFEIDLAK